MMDLKEALERLNSCDAFGIPCGYLDGNAELVKFCREYLSKEPCEDAISREDAITHLRADTLFVCVGDKEQAIKDIMELPSVHPKVKAGHWRAVYQGDEIIDYRCSECEFGNTFGKGTYRMNYCPNCGAKMVAS